MWGGVVGTCGVDHGWGDGERGRCLIKLQLAKRQLINACRLCEAGSRSAGRHKSRKIKSGPQTTFHVPRTLCFPRVTGTRVQISVHVPTPTSDVAARKWAKSLTNALKRQNFSASGGRLRRGACCTVNPAWLQEEVRHKPGAHLTMGMARAFKK